MNLIEDKYIGLGLALSSSLAIGTSFIITKKGLMAASDQHGFEGDGFEYLKNPVWWAGMVTMAIGEVANFAAYTFAPPILVTPLGALAVIIGAVLASLILKEELGILGKLGCAICLIGSLIIVLHAPPDKDIQTVDEILNYAVQPGFLLYVFSVTVFAVVMIYMVAPKYGPRNPMVYVSICSTVGSVSVMSIKGFGIAVKLTFEGNNQFTHPSTYVFAIVVVVCILTQMNYFNKALDRFDTSIVNPLYYVTFTTATLCASFILFKGFNTTDASNTISLICGFLIIFSGVYLLNISRGDPDGRSLLPAKSLDGMPMDNTVAALQTRRSMQLSRNSGGFGNHRRSDSFRQQARLTNDYGEDSFGLTTLDEDFISDDGDEGDEGHRKQDQRLLRRAS
jgi:magnesium transporter